MDGGGTPQCYNEIKKPSAYRVKCICFKSDGFLYLYKAADKVCFLSWTTLGILLKFAFCHFDDYDDYLKHFQLPTSI